jgi:hypothetical protein
MSSHKGHLPEHGPGGRKSDRLQSSEHGKSTGDSSPPNSTPEAAGRSGRPTFDSRGNAVWEWQTEETGKFSKDVSTQRLKKLEAPELSLEETSKVKKLKRSGTTDKGGGFNPYERATPENSKQNAQLAKDSSPARKPIKDLKRYDEWLKMKKRMETEKEDD